MFTHKDIEHRSIFVINTLEGKTLCVRNGELRLLNTKSEKTLTKMPFQKILALFIIGHISITSPLIEKCQQHGIALVVMKPSLRPIFFFSQTAEANYLLRKVQYEYGTDNLTLAKHIVSNKITNQITILKKIRTKSPSLTQAIKQCQTCHLSLNKEVNYEELMGLEGRAAKATFSAMFEGMNWKSRIPRAKTDILNATLDIGYTILFNYVEVFVRLFGFDPYVGVYHRLWFRRKSLICDLMEAFRPIIDAGIRKAFRKNSFSLQDFQLIRGQYLLRPEKNTLYTRFFFDLLIPYKMDLFFYIRNYYRHLMQRPSMPQYNPFLL